MNKTDESPKPKQSKDFNNYTKKIKPYARLWFDLFKIKL